MTAHVRSTSLDVLTPAELAKALDVDVRTLHRWRKELGLPYTQRGRRIYFRAATVDQWLADKERVDEPTPTPVAVTRKRRSYP